jgi:hypothetical protein
LFEITRTSARRHSEEAGHFRRNSTPRKKQVLARKKPAGFVFGRWAANFRDMRSGGASRFVFQRVRGLVGARAGTPEATGRARPARLDMPPFLARVQAAGPRVKARRRRTPP